MLSSAHLNLKRRGGELSHHLDKRAWFILVSDLIPDPPLGFGQQIKAQDFRETFSGFNLVSNKLYIEASRG